MSGLPGTPGMMRWTSDLTGVRCRTRAERALIRGAITRLLQERSSLSAGHVVRLVHLTAMVALPRGAADELSAFRLLEACRSQLTNAGRTRYKDVG
jgi:hypothetical protein